MATTNIPDWHRQVVQERLVDYRAGTAGQGRDWETVRQELKALLAKAR